MTQCDFGGEARADQRYTCRQCGRVVVSPQFAPPRIHAVCLSLRTPQSALRTPLAPCVHRGPEIGQQECETCRGKTRIKIFRCEVHQSCTIAKALDGRACCGTCQDFKSLPAAAVSP